MCFGGYSYVRWLYRYYKNRNEKAKIMTEEEIKIIEKTYDYFEQYLEYPKDEELKEQIRANEQKFL